MEASAQIEAAAQKAVRQISLEAKSRGFRAANELRIATMEVLRGQRSGRIYRVPGTRAEYRASAPGEPPAVRTGTFRNAWQQRTYAEDQGSGALVHAVVQNGVTVKNGRLLGDMLEHGTPRMAPRPYRQAIIDKATPKIRSIYGEPYHLT